MRELGACNRLRLLEISPPGRQQEPPSHKFPDWRKLFTVFKLCTGKTARASNAAKSFIGEMEMIFSQWNYMGIWGLMLKQAFIVYQYLSGYVCSIIYPTKYISSHWGGFQSGDKIQPNSFENFWPQRNNLRKKSPSESQRGKNSLQWLYVWLPSFW